MKLNQFIKKYPERMFVRFFYDVEYDYGVTRHCCLYVKYEQGKFEESEKIFLTLFNLWQSGQMDNKQTIRGYDRIFKAKQLLNQFKNCQRFQVNNVDNQYYFLEII